ncbi:hypothetical protein PRCB_04420 [Pantoea rodasii]|uniref:Uncharacterized protein n=1 Tax=Pantoea rodasii TaxID=1076549 RepID=A0A2M9WEM6_9GAMM|nr:hypothetical protein HA45_26325 [Pantoea rodasii]PJZ05977.1 hypothetical protein PRCB_04420 [Pantoea rodasii]
MRVGFDMSDCFFKSECGGAVLNDDAHITKDILALLGSTMSEFIRSGLSFEAHDISITLQRLKENEADSVVIERYETLIRLLSKMMH